MHMNQLYWNKKSICILSLKLEFEEGDCHNLYYLNFVWPWIKDIPAGTLYELSKCTNQQKHQFLQFLKKEPFTVWVGYSFFGCLAFFWFCQFSAY